MKEFDSRTYWEERYKNGDNSGAGSYGRLAKYKGEFLSKFVKDKGVTNVIDFGSGDGNQLMFFEGFKEYIGLDVSKTSIGICIAKYAEDKTKSFFLYDPEYFLDNQRLFSADLTLSLDVIYHLTEDRVFDKYMHDLFTAASKYVIIYASNTDKNDDGQAIHVKHRRFTNWVNLNKKDWKLIQRVENIYKLKDNNLEESFADFYIYQKD